MQVNTVRFVPTDPHSGISDPAPGIWIDTHTKIDVFTNTVTSSKPYDVAIDYTDNGAGFTAAEFTSVKITYDDGTPDPNAEAINLPLRINGWEYEATNSTTGGRVVKTKLWLISGKIPDIITRDEPFTLDIEGHFIHQDGTQVPFTIKQHFDIETETGTRQAEEVLIDD
mgnify:CR=1 FL=1